MILMKLYYIKKALSIEIELNNSNRIVFYFKSKYKTNYEYYIT